MHRGPAAEGAGMPVKERIEGLNPRNYCGKQRLGGCPLPWRVVEGAHAQIPSTPFAYAFGQRALYDIGRVVRRVLY